MSKILFTPGPTNVPADVREVLSNDMIHHRMKDFADTLVNLTNNLSAIFGTEERVLTMTCSGTGVMEASVVNLFSKGEKVLVINAGYFGKRFKDISETYGLEVIQLQYDWGSSYKVEEVEEVIKNNPDLKGIFIQYSETSTGVLHNIQKLGELTKDTDILLIVDVISGLVVNEFSFDKWNVDCAIAGSQKGFLLPPGLAFITLSQKAKKAMDKSNLPKFYFDLKTAYKAYEEKKQTPWTPAIGLVVAANYSCKKILNQGLENIQKHARNLRDRLETELTAIGFSLFVEKEEDRGNTLISFLGNKNINTEAVRQELDKKYNFQVAGGQGAFMGKLIRVGTIGELTLEDVENLIKAVKEILNK